MYHNSIQNWKFFLSDDSRNARKNALMLKKQERENEQATEAGIRPSNDDVSLETMEMLLDIHPIADPQISQRVLREQIGAHEIDAPCNLLMGPSGGLPVQVGPFRSMTIQYGSQCMPVNSMGPCSVYLLCHYGQSMTFEGS